MSDNWFKVIIALIPVLGALVTGFVIPWLKSQIGTERLKQYMIWAKNAVQYAEMVFIGEQTGQQKKDYCMNFLNGLINDNGKKQVLTEEQLNVLVESAVQELKLAEKAVAN